MDRQCRWRRESSLTHERPQSLTRHLYQLAGTALAVDPQLPLRLLITDHPNGRARRGVARYLLEESFESDPQPCSSPSRGPTWY